MDYYGLPKEKRWLAEGDNPDSIGGRDTDVSQIGYSLEIIIKGLYPINKVPADIAFALNTLKDKLWLAENAIKMFIEMVSEDAK